MIRYALLLLLFGAALFAQTATFDYYVLSLSWSPDFCASHGTDPECAVGRKFAFVVHGLWPQNEKGYPQNCPGPAFDASQLPPALAAIMPSATLAGHEWSKHGTCSGLSETKYFQTIVDVWGKIVVPPDYKQPLKQIMVPPATLKKNFEAANAGLADGGVKVLCSGKYLSEVRVCLTKDLAPRACGVDVKDTCTVSQVIMRPVR